MRKGITPIIAIIILLLITIALAGAAWAYLQGMFLGRVQRNFEILSGTSGAYCENGIIYVYVVNTGYDWTLTDGDFIIHTIDGISTTLVAYSEPEGEAALLVQDDNGVAGWSGGYHTIRLATDAMSLERRVSC